METSMKMVLKVVVLVFAVMSTIVGGVQVESGQDPHDPCIPCLPPGGSCCLRHPHSPPPSPPSTIVGGV
ncbi:hypothetical protein L195_g063130, partial [Trifolium pratense]